jgi:hypothetical protein
MRELQIVLDGCARRDERQAWLAAQYAAFAYHNPKEMPGDPMRESAALPVNPKVAEEIREIRRQVKLAHDTAKARGA